MQTVATELADYALCMVGPTGPTAIRDNLPDFQRLVRRRLVAAAANERPFTECAAAARDLTGSVEIERLHRSTAWSFSEYGAGERSGATAKLTDMAVSARPLVELTERAWPFVKTGYTKLVRPSIAAREAVHPVELARPALGKGLPQWRTYYYGTKRDGNTLLLAAGQGAHLSAFESRDGGLNWSPTQTGRVADVSERCVAEGATHSFTLASSDDGKTTLVTTLGPDGPPSSVELAPAGMSVFAVSCDAGTLVAGLQNDDSGELALALCPVRTQCTPMPMPRFSGIGALPRSPVDIARIGGTTVLATTMQGIVRVASTRDDGRTWAPFNVAFDEQAYPEARGEGGVPGRLLVVGSRLLLFAGGQRPDQSYAVLYSDDQGASFRGASPPAVARNDEAAAMKAARGSGRGRLQ